MTSKKHNNSPIYEALPENPLIPFDNILWNLGKYIYSDFGSTQYIMSKK